MSHSAVSLRIKALEDEIGAPVLERTARPVRLTAIGLELLDHARELERLTRAVKGVGHSGNLRGLLRLGAVPTTLTRLVPPALAELRRRHPEIELQLRSGLSGELALSLRQGEIDAALVSEPALPDDAFLSSIIATEPLVLIAGPTTQDSGWRQALSHAPFIWFSRKTWAGQMIERMLLNERLSVRGEMEVDSLEAITAMVAHGLGVSIVPKRAGEFENRINIKEMPLGNPGLVRRLVLLRPVRHNKSRLADALITCLRDAEKSA